MIILIPMAGAGSRFQEVGYKIHKPAIPTSYWKTGQKLPMVVCAALDLPGIDTVGRLILIDRDFHQLGGVETEVKKHLPKAEFVTIDHLTEGQASTCLLARDIIDVQEDLLIAGCDNGMIYDVDHFEREKQTADILVFTHTGHHGVRRNPSAYGWCVVGENNEVLRMSVKTAISENPQNDPAVVATFYFRHGADFVRAAEKMIRENNRINGEFYVDQVIQHGLELGLKVKVFPIRRYLGWGTPQDWESYEATLKYWTRFQRSNPWMQNPTPEIDVSLVIPCYNEAENLPSIIKRVQELHAVANEGLEVILVDNGSTDQSASVLEHELGCVGNSMIRVIKVEKNLGYGFGILSGLREAQGKVLAWTHADMQTDPLDVWKAFEKYQSLEVSPPILVKGRRKKRRALESFFTWGMELVVWSRLGYWLRDINAQPKLFSREFYERYLRDQAPHDFSLDLFLLYQGKKAGGNIFTVPVFFAKRTQGVAKGGGGSDIWTRIRLMQRTFRYIATLARSKKG